MTAEEEVSEVGLTSPTTSPTKKKKKKSRKSVAVSLATSDDEATEKKKEKKKKEKTSGDKSEKTSSSSSTGEKKEKKDKKDKDKKDKGKKDKEKKEKSKKSSSSKKKSSKAKSSSTAEGGEGTTSTASDDEFGTSQGSIFSTDDDEDFIGDLGSGDEIQVDEPKLLQEEDVDILKPIPLPDNPKMEKINLLLEQPNLEKLTMYVDPANTNIRMIREFLQENYYKEHKLPRKEQRTLLYKRRPIFLAPPPNIELDGGIEYDDVNVLDSYTLADYGIVDEKSKIELSKMIVYVIAPTTKQSMMINNVDPMYDVIFDMKKLALQDGYPIERLKLLHKEANNKEIQDDKNEVTFYDCGIKDHHTLILEWPYITLYIKVPKNMNSNNDGADERDFMILDLELQAEMEQVHKIREFIFAETGIPKQYHKLLATSTQCPPNKSGGGGKVQKEPKQIPLDDVKKLIADYKLQDNDVIELLPMTVKMNYIEPDAAAGDNKVVEAKFYPNDTIGYVKNTIAKGIQDVDGIPKTNVSIKFNDKDVTKYNSKTLYELDVVDGSQFNIEKERITVKIQLPDRNGKNGKVKGDIIELGINPKLDDIDTIKDIIADKTGVPKQFLPRFAFFKDAAMEDDDDGGDATCSKKKLSEFNIVEFDTIQMEPMTLYVENESDPRNKICIEDIDPFNDTIDDVKEKIAIKLSTFPVNKQRLLFGDDVLDDGAESGGGSKRRLFECDIRDSDTVQLEKSKINIKIRHPNEEDVMNLEDVDPRKDNLQTIQQFLSRAYYLGKDQDGSHGLQLRPLRYKGALLNDANKTLRDYGFTDDTDGGSAEDIVIMEPMVVNVIPPGGDASRALSCTVDPMEDTLMNAKLLIIDEIEGIPMDMLAIIHKKASDGRENLINEDDPDKETFYDYHIGDNDTLFIQRKPISIQVKLPEGSKIHQESFESCDDDGRVEVCNDEGGNGPTLIIKVDPDGAELDTIRKYIQDYVGVPIKSQKLNKIVDGDKTNIDDVSGNTKLSDPTLSMIEDCTIELAPMVLNIKGEDGEVRPIEVLPSSTIEEIKKRLEHDGIVSVPHNKQRLLLIGEEGDPAEIGGDDDNENSRGSDKLTLLDVDLKDGDTFMVEKSKISLDITLPHNAGVVEVVVNPNTDTADKIRQQIFDLTGFPMKYQQRFTFNDDLLDDGYKEDDKAADGDDAAKPKKKCLGEFKGLAEKSSIVLEPTRVTVMKVPENDIFVIENVNPMVDTMQELKKKIALKISIPPFKQRLADSIQDEEYVHDKNDSKVLVDYGINDGHVILLEKPKIDIRIILPDLQELELTVDNRYDDIQKIRDYVFLKYYKQRKVPPEDLRPMTIRARVVDNEPGDKKLIKFGIRKDRDQIKLKPCELRMLAPGQSERVHRTLHVPNADPFHDTLSDLIDLAKKERINVQELQIEVNGKIMTEFGKPLYDLNISDHAEIHFVRKE